MRKFCFLIPALLLAGITVSAQDSITYWKKSLQTGLNINQAAFSDNWKGGGTSSLALGALCNAKANYNSGNKLDWDNDLQLSYGFVQNKGENVKKTVDRIYLDSKLGYKIANKWNLFGSMNFTSQFDAGFSYAKDPQGVEQSTLISKFMAPGYLTSSLGIEYKPVDYFWTRFGLGTLRQTFVLDTTLYQTEPKNYGVEVGKKMKSEAVFQLTSNFDRDIMKNTNLKVRMMALAPYESLTTIVSRMDVLLSAKVNKFISVSVALSAINDMNQDAEVQFSQIFGLGIMYNFSEFK
jgi:hypothetical protein